MFDHVAIRVSDRAASERFYGTVLPPLGIDEKYRTDAVTMWKDFLLAAADDATPPTRRLHIGLVAPTTEQVDAFWRAGTEAGYPSDGEPGPRPQYRDDYYGAFLLDPDGNSVEAVNHGDLRSGGNIDHLWIRVADLAESRRFYETIAPHAGLTLRTDTPERVQYRGPLPARGSFSLVPGPPTEALHMAFETTDDGDIQRFHESATAAAFESHGEPGERARYHAGYYAAYVLDPDGNNIEVVNHHRDG